MESLILCIIVWAVVFILLPLNRIRDLSAAAIIAFVWMIFVDNVSITLGYYRYQHTLIAIGRAPLFQNLAEAGLGILMLNWLTESPLSKLSAVLIMAVSFVMVHTVFIQRGVFTLGRLDMTLNFIHHIAALSIFLWISLAAVGEQTIYTGNTVRRRIRRIV
jgi:hypothetical protein